MKIGLLNVERQIFNTALMQISEYHKAKGDDVELYSPLFRREYGLIYASSLFDFSDKSQVPPEAIKGGTGFSVESRLPIDIECCNLDYSLFPGCDRSYLWFSRGCPNSCRFCVVPAKEGRIYPVQPKNLNPKGKLIEIMDNNFFASPNWKSAIDFLKATDQGVVFSSGIDVRLINDEQCGALRSLPIKVLHVAWDNPQVDLSAQLNFLGDRFSRKKIRCYVLIGYDSSPEEDLNRVETLRAIKIDPFVMPYDRSNTYQRRFARWVNHKATWKTVRWEDYHG